MDGPFGSQKRGAREKREREKELVTKRRKTGEAEQ